MATPQPRSKLYSIGAMSLAVGLALFLVLSPAVEREAYLAQIRDPTASWDSAMLHLCWIEPGRAGLNASLPDLNHAHRIGVLEEARKAGCLNLLAPSLQAGYWIWNPEVKGAKGEAIALGRESIGPALRAVESSTDSEASSVRQHAVDVLVALQDELGDAEVARLKAAGVEDELAGLTARFAHTDGEPASGGAGDEGVGSLDPDAGSGPDSDGGTDGGTGGGTVGDEADLGAQTVTTETAAPTLGEMPKLRLREPRLEVRSPGVLFAADPEQPNPATKTALDPEQAVELAPPPRMPTPQGDDDVEQ